jgi:hypothetical protein
VNLPLFLTPERASWVGAAGAAGGFAILMRVMGRAGTAERAFAAYLLMAVLQGYR